MISQSQTQGDRDGTDIVHSSFLSVLRSPELPDQRWKLGGNRSRKKVWQIPVLSEDRRNLSVQMQAPSGSQF